MTPTKTPFAGFEVLGPGDPLSSDGSQFTLGDPPVADRLGRIGAVTHKHDAHAALANPSAAPTLATPTTGGSIPSNKALHVQYTLLDADGGETLPVAPAIITTPAGYTNPTGAPTATIDHTAGTLQAGNYIYALSVTDGAGGETILGPPRSVTIPPGFANSEAALSGFTAIVNAASGGAGGAGWRLWRKQGGGPWYLIATGAAATNSFTDTGITGDCTVSPQRASTTKGTNVLNVTVPSGQPAGAVNFSIYLSLDGSFNSPALLGTYPIADTGTVKSYTSLAVLTGAPPPVSRAFPGANQVNAETDLINLHWLKPVATASVLPTTGNADGDMRVALDSRLVYQWKQSAGSWIRQPMRYPVANSAALPTVDLRDGDMCVTLDTHTLNVYNSGTTTWSAVTGGGGGGSLVFGDGGMGTRTCDGSTAVTGMTITDTNEYTMISDGYYANLTINSGVSVITNGRRLYVNGTLTNNGTIKQNGSAGVTWTGGSGAFGQAASTTFYNGGGNGGFGTTPGDSENPSLGGGGGYGGGGFPASGQSNPGSATASTAYPYPRDITTVIAQPVLWSGGGGGGSGSLGGGGGGGGILVIFAKSLVNNGAIQARGGAGYGVGGSGNGAGGGGGGFVFLAYNSLTGSGTVDANAGAGGAGTNAGAAGTNGRVEQIAAV